MWLWLWLYFVVTCILGGTIPASVKHANKVNNQNRINELFDYYTERIKNVGSLDGMNVTFTQFLLNNETSRERHTAIIDDNYKIIMCSIPKVGCTQWRKLMLLLAVPEMETHFRNFEYGLNYTGPGKVAKFNPRFKRHFAIPNVHGFQDVKTMYRLSDNDKLKYYNNASYLKVVHVRNPVTRILSAWLSKNNQSDDRHPWAENCATFKEFVESLVETDMNTADEHIRPQSLFCDIHRGITYDIYLKFEERSLWQSRLFHYLELHKDPRFAVNYDKSLNLKTKLSSIKKRRYGIFDFQPQSETGASNYKNLLKHYDKQAFDIICSLYKKDIEMFNYEEEVQEMAHLFI